MSDYDAGLEDARDDLRAEQDYRHMLRTRGRWEQHYEPMPATLDEAEEQAVRKYKPRKRRKPR